MCPSSPAVSDPGSSRLCKRALYSYFFKVAQQNYLVKLPTYYSVKVGVSKGIVENICQNMPVALTVCV